MRVTEIQRFCMHDGPGVRTTVFLKGCPLRCRWCHNPETQSAGQQILYDAARCIGCGACATVCPVGAHRLGEDSHAYNRTGCTACARCADACPTGALAPAMREMTEEEILAVVERDRAFYGEEGGVTLSGGEPMAQPEAALRLLRLCRERGVGTAVETCGCFDPAYLPALAEAADLLLWDFKDGNDARHRENTGASGLPLTRGLIEADARGAESVLRCILLRGVNMEEGHYRAIAALWSKLRRCRTVELLPYHPFGGAKRRLLGEADDGREDWIPMPEEMEQARDFLSSRGVRVRELSR